MKFYEAVAVEYGKWTASGRAPSPDTFYADMTDLVGDDYQGRKMLDALHDVDRAIPFIRTFLEKGADGAVEELSARYDDVRDVITRPHYDILVGVVAHAADPVGYPLPQESPANASATARKAAPAAKASAKAQKAAPSNDHTYAPAAEPPRLSRLLTSEAPSRLATYGTRVTTYAKKAASPTKGTTARTAPITRASITNPFSFRFFKPSPYTIVPAILAVIAAAVLCFSVSAAVSETLAWDVGQWIIGIAGGVLTVTVTIGVASLIGGIVDDNAGEYPKYSVFIRFFVLIANLVLLLIYKETYTVVAGCVTFMEICSVILDIAVTIEEGVDDEIIYTNLCEAGLHLLLFFAALFGATSSWVIGIIGGILLLILTALLAYIIDDCDFFRFMPLLLGILCVANLCLALIFGEPYIVCFRCFAIAIAVGNAFALVCDDNGGVIKAIELIAAMVNVALVFLI